MKQKFFVDFDDVLVKSSESFCTVYNQRYKNHPNFKSANYLENNDWNFTKTCSILEGNEQKIHEIFSSEEFFDQLKVQFYCQEILEKWKDYYDYYLVTIGTKRNLQLKIDYVDKHFPMIKDLILLNSEGLHMNKSIVNMKGKYNIFLDDHQSNLYSVKVDIPVLYMNMGTKEWNKNWNKYIAVNWSVDVNWYLDTFCLNKLK